MRLSIFRYRLPLRAPLDLGRGVLGERTGFLLRVSDDGLTGWGEAAPLPGFSRESEEETLAAMLVLGRASNPCATVLDDAPSSVGFAMESAMLDLRAQREGTTQAMTLNPAAASSVRVNALLTALDRNCVEDVRRLTVAGYQAIKIKVGRGPIEREIERTNVLLDELAGRVQVRLDANRAWSFEEAMRFTAEVDVGRLAYVEEPLAQPGRLEELVDRSGMPVALDESLVGIQPDDLASLAFARAVVLKPTVAGGLRWSQRMAERATDLGIVPVVSGAFESGVGTRTLVALAAACAPSPAGLSTYGRLASDVLVERLPLDAPTIDVTAALAPRLVALTWLEALI